MIITIKTDQPTAEIGLFAFDGKQLAYEQWQAHRQLAETIHQKINKLLQRQNKDWSDIIGVVVFAGPGSFTGLRIGFSVANAIGHTLNIPVQAKAGDDWVKTGFSGIKKQQGFKPVEPNYGAPVHITKPKK